MTQTTHNHFTSRLQTMQTGNFLHTSREEFCVSFPSTHANCSDWTAFKLFVGLCLKYLKILKYYTLFHVSRVIKVLSAIQIIA